MSSILISDNTRRTVRLCYAGMIVLALVVNLTPPLFIPLKIKLGLTFEQLGRLVMINFVTQVTFDLICGALIDRLGAKRFAVGANILAACGLFLFAFSPSLFDNPYHGIVLGTIVFSMGGGILELILSPIVNAVPSERKAADMNLLHSFYAIGAFSVVLLTVLAVFLLGSDRWRWIVLAWTAVPISLAIGFLSVHIPPFVEEEKRQKLRQLIRKPGYLAILAAIGLAGASELVLAQWVSAYAERGLGFSKITGDLVGCCLFAAALGVSRVYLGLKGEKFDLYKVMIRSCWLALAVYFVASLSPSPAVALAAVAMGGLGVSALWPGLLSLSAARYPQAGGSMFAMLSASGDLGGAIVPWLVGLVADRIAAGKPGIGVLAHLPPEQLGLRVGLLLAAACPAGMLLILYWLRARQTAASSVSSHAKPDEALVND